MYEESSLDRLRQRYPDLNERELQLADVLDSLGVSGREALPKVRAWLDAGEDPNAQGYAIQALHGTTIKESLLTRALIHGRVESVRLLLARGARVEDSHFSSYSVACARRTARDLRRS